MAVVRYLVADVAVAGAFYVNVMDFELVEQWGAPFAMVKRGHLTLWLSGVSVQRNRAVGRNRRVQRGAR